MGETEHLPYSFNNLIIRNMLNNIETGKKISFRKDSFQELNSLRVNPYDYSGNFAKNNPSFKIRIYEIFNTKTFRNFRTILHSRVE